MLKSSWWKYKEVSNKVVPEDNNNPWPFKMKLTTDNLRWDSLKIAPSRDFEDHIGASLNEAGRRELEAWSPVKILIYDTDTGEAYQVELAKKESFWFDPLPLPHDKMRRVKSPLSHLGINNCDLVKARQKYAYSIEPFRGIKKKRGLEWDQEIALRWSGSESVNRFDFSVVHVPSPWDLRSMRI